MGCRTTGNFRCFGTHKFLKHMENMLRVSEFQFFGKTLFGPGKNRFFLRNFQWSIPSDWFWVVHDFRALPQVAFRLNIFWVRILQSWVEDMEVEFFAGWDDSTIFWNMFLEGFAYPAILRPTQLSNIKIPCHSKTLSKHQTRSGSKVWLSVWVSCFGVWFFPPTKKSWALFHCLGWSCKGSI